MSNKFFIITFFINLTLSKVCWIFGNNGKTCDNFSFSGNILCSHRSSYTNLMLCLDRNSLCELITSFGNLFKK